MIGAVGKALSADPCRNSRASEPVVAVFAEEGGAALASIAEEPAWTPTGVLGLLIRRSADVDATDPSEKSGCLPCQLDLYSVWSGTQAFDK